MRALASTDPDPHLMRMLDEFDHSGPNGRHKCLVLELLGPCVPDVIESRFPDGRLPSQLAKSIAKQSLKGLRALHAQKIAHGGEFRNAFGNSEGPNGLLYRCSRPKFSLRFAFY